jgi:hypothetical protein
MVEIPMNQGDGLTDTPKDDLVPTEFQDIMVSSPVLTAEFRAYVEEISRAQELRETGE